MLAGEVRAGEHYGLPLSGTMAHAYVLSFAREADAFRTFARDFPQGAMLLIDTYDTLEGTQRVASDAKRTARRRRPPSAACAWIRATWGARVAVRRILDEAGCGDLRIFASGDLDEYRIAALLAEGAPIDAFGVGTRLGTSADAPSLAGVYKLVADADGPKMKRSMAKANLPGVKQAYPAEREGQDVGDTIALASEESLAGRPLLTQVMAAGERLAPAAPLATLRARRERAVARLPEAVRRLDAPPLRVCASRPRSYNASARLRLR